MQAIIFINYHETFSKGAHVVSLNYQVPLFLMLTHFNKPLHLYLCVIPLCKKYNQRDTISHLIMRQGVKKQNKVSSSSSKNVTLFLQTLSLSCSEFYLDKD